jgi:hypothetical protein
VVLRLVAGQCPRVGALYGGAMRANQQGYAEEIPGL